MGVPAPSVGEPWLMAGPFGDHLRPHKHEHCRQAVVQEPKQVHHPGEEEVEGPQPQNREHVRREDDEAEVVGMLVDDAEDRRHAIDRKQDIGAFHDEEHEEQRCGNEFARLADEEPVPLLVVRDGDHPADELEEEVITGIDLLVAERELDAGVDEERPEQRHHPLEPLDELRPQEHERQPHDDGAEDPPEENPVLVLERHLEIAEHHREHEHVVHRQRPFDEVAGEELDRGILPQPPPHQAVEGEGQGGPEAGPETALAERRLVGFAVEYRQVERQHDHDEGGEGGPVGEVDRADGGSSVGRGEDRQPGVQGRRFLVGAGLRRSGKCSRGGETGPCQSGRPRTRLVVIAANTEATRSHSLSSA